MNGTFGVDDLDPMLGDLLCLPRSGDEEPESHRGRVSRRMIRGALQFVDQTGIVAQVDQWRRDDDPGFGSRGGRPRHYEERTVLAVMFALAFAGESPLVSRVAEVIYARLHSESRDLLGLPRHVKGLTQQVVYARVYRTLRSFVDVIEIAPHLPRQRRLRADVEADLAALDPEHLATRQARTLWVTNQCLETTARMLPAETLSKWNGNLCIDATLVRVWGKHGSPTNTKKRPGRPDDVMSPEVYAGWYHRDGDHRDVDGMGRKASKNAWGYEAHLGVMTASDPTKEPEYPLLVLAMSLDKPAGRIAENALDVIRSVTDRGHPTGYLVGDRAYFPNPHPATLQLPARALGYRLVGDYRDDQLGVQAEFGGAIMVEGGWYCPSMPQPLIDASADVRAGRIDEDTYADRIAQRAQYAFRPKQKPTADGNTPYMCPARGSGATAECPLASKPGKAVGLGMPTFRTRILNPPQHPDTCCTNKTSISIPVDPVDEHARGKQGHHAAKYAQDLRYMSPEWREVYATLRNTIEGFNAYSKTPNEENLEEPARRRLRGRSMQALLVAVTVAASNVRKIRSFMERQSKPGHIPGAPKKRLRPPTGLQAYRPDPHAPPAAIPA